MNISTLYRILAIAAICTTVQARAQHPITFSRELKTSKLYRDAGVPDHILKGERVSSAISGLKTTKGDTPCFVLIPGSNTSDIILYNDISKTAKIVSKELKKKYNKYYDSASRAIVAEGGVLGDISKKLKELDELNEMQMDTVNQWKNFAREYKYRAKSSGVVSFLFVYNDIDAQLFFKSVADDRTAGFLQNTMISYATDGGKASLYSELYSDYFGPIRFGFGALISNKETKVYTDTAGRQLTDSTTIQSDAMQRLLGGGGNATGTFTYPLLNIQSNSRRFSTRLFASLRGGVDVPRIGTERSDFAWNFDPALETYVYFIGGNNTITPFANLRLSYVKGNKVFRENLLYNSESGFSYHMFTVGFAIKSTFRVSFSFPFGDRFVTQNSAPTVAVSIIPQ